VRAVGTAKNPIFSVRRTTHDGNANAKFGDEDLGRPPKSSPAEGPDIPCKEKLDEESRKNIEKRL